MAYESEQTGGAQQQGTAGGNGSKVREHLKAAGTAAGDRLKQAGTAASEAARARGEQATEWARTRGGRASEWARSQLTGLQGRVESDPQRATLWALGVGLVFGMILSSLVRGGRSTGHREE